MFADRFRDQVAIVTGGCSGLGRAIVDRLVAEQGTVVVFDNNRDALQALDRSDDSRIYGQAVDITDEKAVAIAVEAVVEQHGQLDVMVNCAGIAGPTSMKTTDVPLDAFEKTVRLNLTGAFIMTKHALKAMLPRNYGRILLLSSMAGKDGNAGMAAYSSSKSGVIGLVKSAGKEFAETGITVNGLAPTVVWTTMVEGLAPEQVKYMTDKIPMKRCGTLDEVAAISAWIVSKEASFNTAFVFDLSGGRAVY